MSKVFQVDCQIDEIVIIAPGPSLTQQQCDMVMEAGKTTIVIGNAWRMCKYADILYHCDKKWWDYHKGCPDFQGDRRVSLEPTEHTLNVLQSLASTGFDNSPYVVTGNNSGYQALNLALHFKPKKIYLLGYDMQPGPNGEHNIDGQHPRQIRRGINHERNINNFRTLVEPLEKAGVTVYNCTLDTALDCFEKRELIDVL